MYYHPQDLLFSVLASSKQLTEPARAFLKHTINHAFQPETVS